MSGELLATSFEPRALSHEPRATSHEPRATKLNLGAKVGKRRVIPEVLCLDATIAYFNLYFIPPKVADKV